MRRPKFTESGFTYLALIFAVAIMMAALGVVGKVWHQAQQREKEKELLYIGNQFRKAIGLFYQRSPGTGKRFPRTLDELLEDNRYPTPQRYLRKIYRDPMTGTTEWGLITGPDGGIVGVHSLSEKSVLKTGNFKASESAFTGKATYKEWEFAYTMPLAVVRPGLVHPPPSGQQTQVSPSLPGGSSSSSTTYTTP